MRKQKVLCTIPIHVSLLYPVLVIGNSFRRQEVFPTEEPVNSVYFNTRSWETLYFMILVANSLIKHPLQNSGLEFFVVSSLIN